MSGESASAAPPRAAGSVSAPSPSQNWRRLRFIPLAAGAGAFAAGIWAGLARLGLAVPGGAGLAEFHAALMISGFLGTVIALERAVAIGRWWGYLAPALSAAAAVMLVAGAPFAGAVVFLFAGILLTINSAFIVARQPALFTAVLTVASACWVAGTVSWMLGAPPGSIAGWWLAFLVLTIVSERLELSRLLSPPRSSQLTFIAAVALILAGAVRGELAGAAAPFSGVGLLAVTAWLLRHDIAMRTVRFTGLARFSAACILAGYFWLLVAGVLLLIAPPGVSVFSYDAIVHAVAIGFVLSMILGHAPIILPAVTGLRVRYGAAAYLPLILLHASVGLRVGADLLAHVDLRVASGPTTVVAVVGYAIVLVAASLRRTAAPAGFADEATPRRPRWAAAMALAAIVFGIMTVFVGGKTLFGGAEARAAAGHFVPFVLWFNFAAGFAYIIAGGGLLAWKRWAAALSAAIALGTVLVFIAFGAHILSGGAFEMRTVGAMIIRSAAWVAIAASACRAMRRHS